MNEEEKKFLTDLVDKERKFHIELADIGMRFGALVAVALILFSTGVGLLFSAVDMLIKHAIDSLPPPCATSSPPCAAPLPQADITPLLVGIIFAGFILLIPGAILLILVVPTWKNKKISDLKKSS